MTTARNVIQDCLTFHLNRLSPGETADADVLATCLAALDNIADELNGTKAFLFREILTASSSISTATALLGTAWSTLSPGDEISGATWANNGQDVPMSRLSMQQYHEQVYDKAQRGQPCFWAHDGLATLYFTPVPTGHVITLRTKQVVSNFAAVDTDYSMPNGYRAGLAALLAEKLAPTMNPGALAECRRTASAARGRLHAQAINPAILGGSPRHGNIERGW